MADYILPRTYAHTIAAMRPNLTRALIMAVESGDAATAASLFPVVAGPGAAAHMGPRDVLDKVGAWLSSQSELANEVMAA
ncbi:hypothetical protein ACFO5Q_18590 [Kordiimonas lipolytica]|uniref:Uncharacterized protein n=1 Tax=Kordiimonas lipolytica TaxID=1662421 RepID=A0ABV8UHA9_9PROT|nr:hypothetical protein [Kordiimonas lipolytica]